MAEYTIQPIRVEEARYLRRTILRPNLPIGTIFYPGDDTGKTLHTGAFVDDVLIGVCTILHEAPAGENDIGAWRLRGVAVDPRQRGQGIGRALIEACIAHAKMQGASYVWANGRESALPVYAALGSTTQGDVYVTDTGPHYFVLRSIA
jgi:GNAT superfamily N-acetyltransferase